MTSSTDHELVQRLQTQDAQALVQAYEQYSARLLGFLLRLTGERALAEDLFQDTWCRLAASARSLRPDTDLFAWLLTVARNGYFDRARQRSRLSSLTSAERTEPPAFLSCTRVPEQESSDREQLRLLELALLALSDVDREILLLVGVEDLSHACAARILGIKDVAFRKRLSRARERLELAVEKLTAVDPHAKGANHG